MPDARLQEYCVAIANEGGGHLVLGIADVAPRAVVGTTAAADPHGMAEKLFAKLSFRVEVSAVEHPQGRVVVFAIPARLRGTAHHLDGRYLMRVGGQLLAMSQDRLRAIFAEGAPDWLQEPCRVDASAEDIIELLDTTKLFELLQLPYPASRAGVIDKLLAERLIDCTGEVFRVRRIAGLLLAKRLDAFPDLARRAPRVVVYGDATKLIPRLDQIGQNGYAVGFVGLVSFVMTQLPQNEFISEALRQERKLVPEAAIRELIANALVHQDFNVDGMRPTIEVYANRVEITNPGVPVVPSERFIDGYQSRNDQLADLMRRMRVCEERGSGIDRVVSLAEQWQLPAPDFRNDQNRTYAVIYGPQPFEEMTRADRVRACYQHCVLAFITRGAMTNTTLRQRFGLADRHAATVSLVIAATVDAELIKPDESVGDSKRYARYLPFWA